MPPLVPASLPATPALVHAIARRIARRLPASIDVRDLVQAAWVRLLAMKAGPWQSDAHRDAAIAQHAQGAMFDEARSQAWGPRRAPCQATPMDELEHHPDPAETPDQVAERTQSMQQLRAAVALLPPRLRDVMTGLLAGETGAAAAARLGVSESRISQLRAQGAKLLRLRLQAPFGLR